MAISLKIRAKVFKKLPYLKDFAVLCFAVLSVGLLGQSSFNALRSGEIELKSSISDSASEEHLALKGDDTISAWIVMFTNLKKRHVVFRTWLESYEMFQNKNVYQKVLIVWDSSQDDSIEILQTLGKIADDIITFDLAMETPIDLNLRKEQFEGMKLSNCFNRDTGYCQQLIIKFYVDVFASAAAKKYELIIPDIVGIVDDDTYWHTLPVKENVVDPDGRIIFHTFEPQIYSGKNTTVIARRGICEARNKEYKQGVVDMLKIDPDSYRNGMVQFPMHVWRETLPRLRQYVAEQHGIPFLDVYLNTTSEGICEFCVMVSYGHLHEADKYTVTERPCPVSRKEYTSNVFQESSDGLPMVGTMQHENPKNHYSCDSCWIKGCCLTYRISSDEAEECANIDPRDFCEMNVYDMIHFNKDCHGIGDNDKMLQKHFELVWKHMDQCSLASIQDGKEKCLSKIKSFSV